jgi:hypothetical protein
MRTVETRGELEDRPDEGIPDRRIREETLTG